MSERDHTGGGGLTGATGDLTFEENDRPFVTAEAREASGDSEGPQPGPPTEREGESPIRRDALTEPEERP